VVAEALSDGGLVQGVLSGPRPKAPEGVRRVTIRPVRLRGKDQYQLAYQAERSVTHRNLLADEARAVVTTLLRDAFREARLETADADITVRVNRHGEARVKHSAAQHQPKEAAHDRAKPRPLPEGTPHDFLVRLGIMTQDGRVVASRQDKYRQVNRFLEMVQDVAGHLPQQGPVRVVDFGCGRSTLTFALYHALKQTLGLEPTVTGLDVRADTVRECEEHARELGYEGLSFHEGRIEDWAAEGPVDLVVCLHACDTATDDALAQAVRWKAKVILAVPCCQHELQDRIQAEPLQAMLRHGIVRERLASLATDCLRAELLESAGYSTRIMEFVETEHTPKNLLLRALRRPDAPDQFHPSEAYLALKAFWHAGPRLEGSLWTEEVRR
jgi:2-polyprenyl-3-methyl-5-hydroxy-6-metoxy-1,4-benzoquinol methylase